MHSKVTKYILTIGGASLLCIFFVAYALDTRDTGYRVNVSHSGAVEFDLGNQCRKVTNNGAADIFVPTATLGERNSFSGYKPVDVSISPGLGICGDAIYTCDVGFESHYECGAAGTKRWCQDICDISLGTHTACSSPEPCAV